MDTKVAKIVDEYTVVINKGSDAGVKAGQRFLIFAFGEDIIDPDTGESLGKLEIVKGTGRVTHCQSAMATVSSDMTTSARRTIRRKANPAFRGILSAMEPLYSQEVEESLPEQKVSFDDPKIGDVAKPI